MHPAPEIWTTQSGKTKIVLPYYFLEKTHREKAYRDGLYGILPCGSVKDPYSSKRGDVFCTDIMEWAFNNSRQPGAETDRRTGKKLPFLDGSGANRVRVLGSLKEAWKAYERTSGLINIPVWDLDVNALNAGFFDYYTQTHPGALENSAEILRRYVENRRSFAPEWEKVPGRLAYPWFTEKMWSDGCYDFVRHLVWTTPRGYLRELMFFTTIREMTGAGFIESDAGAERKGVDGYLVVDGRKPFPVCVKPSTWSRRRISPIYEGCIVTYLREEDSYPNAVFEFETGGQECLSLGREAV